MAFIVYLELDAVLRDVHPEFLTQNEICVEMNARGTLEMEAGHGVKVLVSEVDVLLHKA